ncbi:hypothetical protein LEP1GSC061_0513 [Leptospira wolffii serovar Khorat str. Khorat-H2]|nr:hypothetical protein LEP1GSC061_0513 [Leptospira wolffii serovar Khorat str. Khorat-H2]
MFKAFGHARPSRRKNRFPVFFVLPIHAIKNPNSPGIDHSTPGFWKPDPTQILICKIFLKCL